MSNPPKPPKRPNLRFREFALQLAYKYCVTDPKPRSAERTIRSLQMKLVADGIKDVPARVTMQEWIYRGVLIDGYPELAQPYDEVARLVDTDELDPNRWRMSINIGNAVATAAHDQAMTLLQEMMKSDDYKAAVQEKPDLHIQALGRLNEAVKARGEPSVNIFRLLDELTNEDAEKVIEHLLKTRDDLMEKLAKAFAGEEQE